MNRDLTPSSFLTTHNKTQDTTSLYSRHHQTRSNIKHQYQRYSTLALIISSSCASKNQSYKKMGSY
eukprot:scaffold476_cov269-Chaetoceros_neogracile.AAC.3